MEYKMEIARRVLKVLRPLFDVNYVMHLLVEIFMDSLNEEQYATLEDEMRNPK
jgi:hypothetical protein